MTYKTILVHLSDEKRADDMLNVASILARKHNAHLVGLYITPDVESYPMAVAVQMSSEILSAHHKQHKERAEILRKKFDDACRKEGIASEWQVVMADVPTVADALIEHSRTADLVIVAQQNQDDKDYAQYDVPERIILESGRPVLIVPYAGHFGDIGNNIMVAWNTSKEASRAIFDAIPVMKMADNVRIFWFNPAKDIEIDEDTATPGSLLAKILARHDIKAEASYSVSNDIGIGDELLSRSADVGSDLLVMGGYGHSRFREMVMGGATRHILKHMTLPILMSH